MTTISAEVIADSIGEHAPRLTTFLLRYPRCIHSEFMTHRVFSRNASSSRAIPVKKLIQDVLDDPFVPLVWGRNQKGMQADEECHEPVQFRNDAVSREVAWLRARDTAVAAAERFAKAGYHKQIVNRLLEPFAHITVVVTATQFSNFFALRRHTDAEPHIKLLADRMWEAQQASVPKVLRPGQWHLPFVTEDDLTDIGLLRENTPDDMLAEVCNTDAVRLSVARCASTSYKTVEGFDMTLDRAVALHDKLVASTPLHASPCEHQATPAHRRLIHGKVEATTDLGGNLGGEWVQYRKLLPGESL